MISLSLNRLLLRPQDHLRDVLLHTLGRDMLTGGRVGESFLKSSKTIALESTIDRICSFVTADVRKNHLVFYQCGRNMSRPEIVEHMLAALLEDGCLRGLIPGVPSKNRWGSCTKHLSEQCAGIMICSILPRVMLRGFQDAWRAGDPGDGEEDDFRLLMKRKVFRSCRNLEDSMFKKSCILACWVTVPIDLLWNKLQHIDSEHGLLFDVTMPRTSPFRQTLLELCARVSEPLDTGPMKAIFSHYEADWEDMANHDAMQERAAIMDLARVELVGLSSQVHFFFILHYEDWPFRLVGIADPRNSREQQLHIAHEFKRTHTCCRDENFSDKAPTDLTLDMS